MATNVPNITVGAIGATGSTFTVDTTGASGGNYLTSAGTGLCWTTTAPYYAVPNVYNVNTHTYDVVIKRDGKEDIYVAKTLEMLMDRLCVIEPNFKLIEKYPALREAYEHYKMMEALLANEDNSQEEK